MAIWRRRKEEPAVEPTPPDDFGQAREALAGGDPQAAVGHLRAGLETSGGLPPLDLVAELGRSAGLNGLADAASRAAESPTDAGLLFGTGYELYEAGLTDVALPVLREAFRLEPRSAQFLAELVSCLDEEGRHRESAALLREQQHWFAGDFMLTYLLAFESVVTGDLRSAADAYAQLPPSPDPSCLPMAQRIEGMLARGSAASGHTPLDDLDLKGWHFVITGGLLLARAGAGLEDGMGGRWAYVQDTYANVLEGLTRAQAVLDEWDRRPHRVLPLPDRASQALGQAAAALLGVPVGDPGDEGPGLLVAYDLAEMDRATAAVVGRHQSQRPLYVHAASWTQPPTIAPDLLMVLYQQLVPPWGAAMRVQERADGTREVVMTEPDGRAPALLAEAILGADPELAYLDPVYGRADVVAFARAVRTTAAGTRDPAVRQPFWAASPVSSSRFI